MYIINLFLFLAGLSTVLCEPQAVTTRTTTLTTTISTQTTPTTATALLQVTTRTRTRTTRRTRTTTTTALATPTRSVGKRGVAFNDPLLTQYFSLNGQGSKINWAYNWASDPYFPGGWTPNSYNNVLRYTPMLWSNATELTSIWMRNVQTAIRSYGADSVLAFNEPDGCCCGGSCMDVNSAVNTYKQWVQPWAGRVRLGAPAVTNGGAAGIGMDYMQQFLQGCTGCTIDFIPIHWYGSVLDPNSFKTYVRNFYVKFRKPIWITEFATTSGTEEQIVAFLRNVLPWLDRQAYVERYSYFMARGAGSPFLLETDNTLTDIGVVFNSI